MFFQLFLDLMNMLQFISTLVFATVYLRQSKNSDNIWYMRHEDHEYVTFNY